VDKSGGSSFGSNTKPGDLWDQCINLWTWKKSSINLG